MGVEVSAGAGGVGEVSMPAEGAAGQVELLGSPGERRCSTVELSIGGGLLVEVTLAENQEVSRWVIVGCGVASEFRAAQFVDVAVAVNADVVGDVDPSPVVWWYC